MDFSDVIDHLPEINEFSRILIHFDDSVHGVEDLIEIVERMGADVIGVEMLPSDRPHSRIASLEVANEDVSGIAVRLIEEESLEVLGLSASAAGASGRRFPNSATIADESNQTTKEE